MRKRKVNRNARHDQSLIELIGCVVAYIPISIGVGMTFAVLIWLSIFYQAPKQNDGQSFKKASPADSSFMHVERVRP